MSGPQSVTERAAQPHLDGQVAGPYFRVMPRYAKEQCIAYLSHHYTPYRLYTLLVENVTSLGEHFYDDKPMGSAWPIVASIIGDMSCMYNPASPEKSAYPATAEFKQAMTDFIGRFGLLIMGEIGLFLEALYNLLDKALEYEPPYSEWISPIFSDDPDVCPNKANGCITCVDGHVYAPWWNKPQGPTEDWKAKHEQWFSSLVRVWRELDAQEGQDSLGLTSLVPDQGNEKLSGADYDGQ